MNHKSYESKPIDDREWPTPQFLFDELNDEFGFFLDACASEENHKCEFYFDKDDNGLVQDWAKFGTVFMNPPDDEHLWEWVEKARDESLRGATVVCLLPIRYPSMYWRAFCSSAEWRDVSDRLSAFVLIPYAIVIFRPKESKGEEEAHPVGRQTDSRVPRSTEAKVDGDHPRDGKDACE